MNKYILFLQVFLLAACSKGGSDNRSGDQFKVSTPGSSVVEIREESVSPDQGYVAPDGGGNESAISAEVPKEPATFSEVRITDVATSFKMDSIPPIDSLLQVALFEKATIHKSITSTTLNKATEKLAQDLLDCGWNFFKICTGDDWKSTVRFLVFEFEGKKVYYTEYEVKGWTTPIALVFTLDSIHPSPIVKSFEAWQISETLDPLFYSKKIESINVVRLFKGTLASDRVALAKKQMQRPRNIRELYYRSDYLRRKWVDEQKENIDFVSSVLPLHAEFILQSPPSIFQRQMFYEIALRLMTRLDFKSYLAKGFLKSKDQDLRRYAATYLYSIEPSRKDLRSQVFEMITHYVDNVENVKSSIESDELDKGFGREYFAMTGIYDIMKVQDLDPSEQDQFFQLLKRSKLMRQLAASRARQNNPIVLSDSQLNQLKTDLISGGEESGCRAAETLSSVKREDDPAIVNMYLQFLSSQSECVHRLAIGFLRRDDLNEHHALLLLSFLESEYDDVRWLAISRINDIKGDVSTGVLIRALINKDSIIRHKARAYLRDRPPRSDHFGVLKEVFEQAGESREVAATLLAQIYHPLWNKLAISYLSDRSPRVGSIFYESLRHRELFAEHIPLLSPHLKSGQRDVRLNVVFLLGRLKKYPSSLAVLKAHREVEIDQQVRDAIDDLLRES